MKKQLMNFESLNLSIPELTVSGSLNLRGAKHYTRFYYLAPDSGALIEDYPTKQVSVEIWEMQGEKGELISMQDFVDSFGRKPEDLYLTSRQMLSFLGNNPGIAFFNGFNSIRCLMKTSSGDVTFQAWPNREFEFCGGVRKIEKDNHRKSELFDYFLIPVIS